MGEELDPLDAFMQDVKATVEVQRAQQAHAPAPPCPSPPAPRPPPRAPIPKPPCPKQPPVTANRTTPSNINPGADHKQSDPSADDTGDPLDAFMAEINAVNSGASGGDSTRDQAKGKPELSEEAADGVDSYVESTSRKPAAVDAYNTPLLEYDDNDNITTRYERTENLVLAPVNHHAIQYEPFNKAFYSAVPALARLSPEEVRAKQREMDLLVTGLRHAPVAPISRFEQAGFDVKLRLAIGRLNFKQPTVIQSQAIPAVLSGEDVIAVAETGSGKTFAFVWPMLTHIMDQRELEKGEGPIAMVLAPTRELVHQLFVEVKRFGRIYGVKACAIYGGTSKWEQTKALKGLCEVVVGTPGRVIDHIKAKTCPMTRVTFFVLDEADQMLSYGFEPQVRTISNQIRPDRQTVLFSATFDYKLKRLAKDLLFKPIEIRSLKVSHQHITQEFVPFQDDTGKWPWLAARLPEMAASGKVLVFVSQRAGVDTLAHKIRTEGNLSVVTLHGDMHQSDRTTSIKSFKKDVNVLVATDVASRGLHVDDMNTVVCYDAAKNLEIHTHRIGRTGRMGKQGARPGMAFVLLTPKNAKLCTALIQHIRRGGEKVPDFLPSFAHGQGQSSNKNRRAPRPKVASARVGYGSGRADVVGYGEKTVGLGYGSHGSGPRHSLSKDSNLYAGFVKGETTAPGLPPIKMEQHGPSREERNAATFTARKKIEAQINSSAMTHVQTSLEAYKAKLGEAGSTKSMEASSRTKKQRWEKGQKKSRWG